MISQTGMLYSSFDSAEIPLKVSFRNRIFALIRKLSGSYRPAAALVFRPSSRSLLMWLLITGSYLMNVYSVVKVLCFCFCCNNSVVTC